MRDFLASRKPSPAMGVAFVALLAALSGTAVALPGKNTVDSGDIKNRQVKGKDVARNAVTGSKIKTGAVKSSDVGNDSLTGTDVNEGTLGQVPSAASADTASNATNAGTADNADNLGGQPAADHLRDFRQVSATSASNSTSPKSATANCAIGEVALGGGSSLSGGTLPENIVLKGSQVFQQFTILGFTLPGGFTATGVETDPDGGNWTVTARATCASGG